MGAMKSTREVIYLNGRFVSERDARVSVFDRCFLYGDGVFEGIAVWNRKPFLADRHLDRLDQGLAFLRIDAPHKRGEWLALLAQSIEHNDMQDGYLRLQVSRGAGMSSIKWQRHLLRDPNPAVTIIPIRGFKDYYAGLFAQNQSNGLRAVTASRPRISNDAIPNAIKHCNYLDSVIGAIEVADRGADLGICVDRDGRVTEGIAYNLFGVWKGAVRTPPVERDILPGVTRQALLELARTGGLEADESDFTAADLYAADEVFISSTLELAVPVVEIDGRAIGTGRPGPIAARLSAALMAAMERGGLDTD
jgi:branched-chain amino acid aminotransferase